MPTIRKVFIGYDHRQIVAYTVLHHSILKHAKCPVSITPLVLSTLPLKRPGGTPFTFSRFLVPWLCDFQGWAVFMDIDMLVTADIDELFRHADDQFAVMVVDTKHHFERASMMLINCGHETNGVLTPEYVESEKTSGLHQIGWVSDQELIGWLPGEWNFMVGTDTKTDRLPKLIHYTQGIPAHPETEECDYAQQWRAALQETGATNSWQSLLKTSEFATRISSGEIVPTVSARYRDEQKKFSDDIEGILAGGYSRSRPGPRFNLLMDLYKEMHGSDTPNPSNPNKQMFAGTSLAPHVENIEILTSQFKPKTLLDYGCGKGQYYAMQNIPLPSGKTIASLKSFWNVREIKLFDEAYAPYSHLPDGQFDGVICTDVLEHCDQYDLGWILGELFAFARQFVYLNVACYAAVKTLPNGENAHVTIRPPQWWAAMLKRVGRQYPHVRYYAMLVETETVNGQIRHKATRLSSVNEGRAL